MADDERIVMHIRVPKELTRQIDHLAVDWDMFRQEAVVRLLEAAIELHRSGRLLVGEAEG